MGYSESLQDRIFLMIKDNPGIVRTEIRDTLGLPNNVVTPAIKQLIDKKMVVEGAPRVSKTTQRLGRTLYVAEEWNNFMGVQNRLFEEG